MRRPPLIDLDTCDWEAWTHSGTGSNRFPGLDDIYILSLYSEAGYDRRASNFREVFHLRSSLCSSAEQPSPERCQASHLRRGVV